MIYDHQANPIAASSLMPPAGQSVDCSDLQPVIDATEAIMTQIYTLATSIEHLGHMRVERRLSASRARAAAREMHQIVLSLGNDQRALKQINAL